MHTHRRMLQLVLLAIPLFFTSMGFSEDQEPVVNEEISDEAPQPSQPSKRPGKKKERRQYVTDHPERSDAGVFYVAGAVGGNFYTEPQVSVTTKAPTGDYFKDFGFQGGAYFDYDYSQLDENIPLALRGFLGYKYILKSIHVFAFDGVVRRMFQLSEKVTFGLGFGGSAAIWFRSESTTPPVSDEEIIFLPSVVVGAGFEFNPFMLDFKWLINKFGADATVTGFELYFGFRL